MAQISDGDFFDAVFNAFQSQDSDVDTKQHEAGHVRCIQLIYHTIARQAFDESLELMDDDVVLEILGPDDSPFKGRWQGHADVLAAIQRNFTLVEDQRPQVQSVVAQGDQVVIVAQETGKIRDNGEPYETFWVQEFNFDRGKLKHVRQFWDGSLNLRGNA